MVASSSMVALSLTLYLHVSSQLSEAFSLSPETSSFRGFDLEVLPMTNLASELRLIITSVFDSCGSGASSFGMELKGGLNLSYITSFRSFIAYRLRFLFHYKLAVG